MDLFTIIGIVSSVLGIYSFVKNDTPLFKKNPNVFKKLVQNTQNYFRVLMNFVSMKEVAVQVIPVHIKKI